MGKGVVREWNVEAKTLLEANLRENWYTYAKSNLNVGFPRVLFYFDIENELLERNGDMRVSAKLSVALYQSGTT